MKDGNIFLNLYTHPDEKLDVKVNYENDKIILRNTRWIAKSALQPIINSVFGNMINQHCHIFDSYSKDHDIAKKQ